MGESLAGPDLPAPEKDSDKTAAAADAAPSRRVPPPIPPRKRDSQLSIVRKESEQRLAPQQPNSKDDLPALPAEGPEGDLKDGGGGDEKGRAANSERRGSSPPEKQRSPEEAPEEGPASSPSGSAGSGKPEVKVAPRGKDVEESLVGRVSNGGSRHDGVRGGGQLQRPNEGGADVRLPEIPNGSAPSSLHGTSVEKSGPSSECGGAKREAEDRDRERQAELVNLDQQHRLEAESESESEPRPRVAVGRVEEIERDSESDSEEGKPLLKERGEGRDSPGLGEGTKSAHFGSEGDAILAAFDDERCWPFLFCYDLGMYLPTYLPTGMCCPISYSFIGTFFEC